MISKIVDGKRHLSSERQIDLDVIDGKGGGTKVRKKRPIMEEIINLGGVCHNPQAWIGDGKTGISSSSGQFFTSLQG